MPLVNSNPLGLALDILRTNFQTTDHTRILLPFSHDSHRLSLVELVFSIWQPSPSGGQPGSHQRRTRQHEADGAAIDLDCWEGIGKCVDEF